MLLIQCLLRDVALTFQEILAEQGNLLAWEAVICRFESYELLNNLILYSVLPLTENRIRSVSGIIYPHQNLRISDLSYSTTRLLASS